MIDITRSIKHPFEDQAWPNKMLIGALISLVPFLNFAGYGWMTEHTKNTATLSDVPMPDWAQDLSRKFMDGLKLFVVTLVYSLPIILLACVFTFAAGGMAALTSDNARASEAAGAGIGVLSIFLMCVIFVYSLFLAYVSPAVLMQFVKSGGDIGACLRLGEVFGIARRNTGDYLMIFVVVIALSFVLSLVFGALSLIPLLGLCLTIPLGLLVTPYVYAVVGQLCGQYMRQHVAP